MIGAVLAGLNLLSILPGVVFVLVKYREWKREEQNAERGFLDFYFRIITDPEKSPLLDKGKEQATPWIPYVLWFVFVNFVMIVYVVISV